MTSSSFLSGPTAAPSASSQKPASAETATPSKKNDGNIHHSHQQKRNVDPSSASASVPASLDFIASSHAVKDLFSLPYAVDRSISVAVHNLEGTLLIDADDRERVDGHTSTTRTTTGSASSAAASSSPRKPLPREEQEHQDHANVHESMSTSLVALSSMDLESEALTIVNSVIESSHMEKERQNLVSFQQQQNNDKENNTLGLPRPEDYVHSFIPPFPEPREYLNWKFHNLNLLVGSDALIYRSAPVTPASASPNATNATPQQPQPFMTVRVEEAQDLKALLQQHENMIRRGQFLPDHQYGYMQQRGKPLSYADATRKSLLTNKFTQLIKEEETEETKEEGNNEEENATLIRPTGSFSAPDLDQVRLQTCIVPSPSSPVGGLLLGGLLQPVEPGLSSSSQQQPQQQQQRLSPVSTVLDVYLDNIMGNVPQLALCLKEKGFIQSVKLLQTHDIPSSFLHSTTFDTSAPFDVVGGGTTKGHSHSSMAADQVFSPQIMESNASTLLQFLKTNCTRDNATYLLRREAGETNLQLYDISTISTQRQQRKWIWWLASMSYRFANRLRHLAQISNASDGSSSTCSDSDVVLQRSCRARQRSLLQNTLDLLDVLSDMEEDESRNQHESLVAAVNENLADTFLGLEQHSTEHKDESSRVANCSTRQQQEQHQQKQPAPATSVSSQQPYGSLSADCLTKAQDHLMGGMKVLRPLLRRYTQEAKSTGLNKRRKQKPIRSSLVQQQQPQATVVAVDAEAVSSDEDDSDHSNDDSDEEPGRRRWSSSLQERIDPVVTQLFGLEHKFVNVSLRLAEIHLRNYYSSSAMQTLRAAARGIADSLYLVQLVERHEEDGRLHKWLGGIQLQYTWLWEHCGHFARSFAADELWRERGHAAGDDIISVLLDAENVFSNQKDGLDMEDPLLLKRFLCPETSLSERSKNLVNLHSLSGLVVDVQPHTGKKSKTVTRSISLSATALEGAMRVLDHQRLILREKRKALVAACIAYCRAIQSFRQMDCLDDKDADEERLSDSTLLMLLQQRLGDACNETGKIMLNELRGLLTLGPENNGVVEGESFAQAAEALSSAAQFWFFEGLAAFVECNDLRNLALLSCNLCQSYKLRANAVFASQVPNPADGPTHAEMCLQEAANHLQAAHEALQERDVDPLTWDMVSEELAATFLVLGVRRRQSLIGSGNLPVIMHALRLSPGKEHSIVDPMERALAIYEQLGNFHQAAAAHYQLALFYSKIWTCQMNEAKTREKLSAAFQHYNASHAFFSQSIRGNEVTFCLLCIDSSSLYATVAGEECTLKALLRCLDTVDAFSRESIDAVLPNLQMRSEWFSKMDQLATTIEERVFKFLRALVGVSPKGTYKELYRCGLQAKMTAAPPNVSTGDETIDKTASHLLTQHSILQKLLIQYNAIPTTTTTTTTTTT